MDPNKKSFLEKVDFLGTKVSLYSKENSMIQTRLGGALSVWVAIMLCLTIAGFGDDFFHRKNPSFIEETVSPTEYQFFNVTNKNFSFAYVLEDINGKQIKNDTHFYIRFLHIRYDKDENDEWVTAINEDLPVVGCREEHFGDTEKFKQKGLSSWLCPDINHRYVGGFWDAKSVSFLRARVYRCIEGQKNLEGKECATKEESSKTLSTRLFFSTITQSYLVNPNNYYTPLSVDYKTRYEQLDSLYFKRMNMLFKQVIVITDYGWLIKDTSQVNILGFSEYNTDGLHNSELIGSNTGESSPSLYYEFTMYFDKGQDKYYREYTKGQELAAQVGGIVKIFYICGMIVVFLYNTSSYEYDIINNVFDGEMKDEPIKGFGGSGNCNDISDISNVQINKVGISTNDADLTTKLKKVQEDFLKKRAKNKVKESPFTSFAYYFCKLKLCICCNKTKEAKNAKFAKIANEQIKAYLDVSCIIKNQMNLEKVMKLLFNEDQRYMIEQMPGNDLAGGLSSVNRDDKLLLNQNKFGEMSNYRK